jgi:hypothetical protein
MSGSGRFASSSGSGLTRKPFQVLGWLLIGECRKSVDLEITILRWDGLFGR